jgi:7-cyano-7-deazaguanine synthase
MSVSKRKKQFGKPKRKRSAICVLASGGLDSCALLAYAAERYRRVYPVFIRCGLIWETSELYALRRFLRATGLPRLTILQLPVADIYGRHWSITGRRTPNSNSPDEDVYLPGRNLLLLAKAATFCAQRRIPTIAIGSLNYNPFADSTPEFFQSFARVANKALGQKLRIIAPFRKLSKTQVIGRYRAFPLQLSFSCLAPNRSRHCGRCNKCAERQRALRRTAMAHKTRPRAKNGFVQGVASGI